MVVGGVSGVWVGIWGLSEGLGGWGLALTGEPVSNRPTKYPEQC